MSNNKQNKIDSLSYFVRELVDLGLKEHLLTSKVHEAYVKAKAMHKEEMLTAMDIAFRDGLYIADESYGESYKSPYDDWEDYYNKTFGDNNE